MNGWLLDLFQIRMIFCPPTTVGSASGEWSSMEMPHEYLELIEERWGKWLCRCPTCELAPCTARDPPDLRRDAT